jgi:hypothetical protein
MDFTLCILLGASDFLKVQLAGLILIREVDSESARPYKARDHHGVKGK